MNAVTVITPSVDRLDAAMRERTDALTTPPPHVEWEGIHNPTAQIKALREALNAAEEHAAFWQAAEKRLTGRERDGATLNLQDAWRRGDAAYNALVFFGCIK